jgi:prepilin-type N-terminal cleavage/methylation domain-containing protein
MLPLGALFHIFQLIIPSDFTLGDLFPSLLKKLNLLRKGSGFTLIELCIVVMILGVLATISFLGAQSYRERAMIAKAQAEIDQIAKAILLLQIETGRWPGGQIPGGPVGSGNEITDLNQPSAGLCFRDGRFPNWNGPYYSPCPIPKDPWGSNYIFDTDYFINGSPRVAVASGGPNQSGTNTYDEDNVVKILQ